MISSVKFFSTNNELVGFTDLLEHKLMHMSPKIQYRNGLNVWSYSMHGNYIHGQLYFIIYVYWVAHRSTRLSQYTETNKYITKTLVICV